MSNVTSGSTEYFPIISQPQKPNQQFRQSIIGEANSVSPSAYDVIINGAGNGVGDICRNINILNSSGCIVSSGVTGVNIIGSSGLFVFESDVTYIANTLIDESVFVTSGVTASQSYVVLGADSLDMTTDNYMVEIVDAAAELYLPVANGQTQIFRVKNTCGSDVSVFVNSGSSDVIERSGIPDDDNVTLGDLDAVTLMSNGSNKYIII